MIAKWKISPETGDASVRFSEDCAAYAGKLSNGRFRWELIHMGEFGWDKPHTGEANCLVMAQRAAEKKYRSTYGRK